MSIIDLSLPCPVARAFTGQIRKIVDQKTDIIVRNIEREEPTTLPHAEGDPPDLIATHSLSILQNRELLASSGHYALNQPGLPAMRPELAEKGFADPSGCFIPLCLIPIVMIYNRRLEDPPAGWEELLDERWHGRIGAPFIAAFRQLMFAYGSEMFDSETAARLVDNTVFEGMPLEINMWVDSGKLDIGIVGLPFSRASRSGNVALCWPQEGAFCLPEVLLVKKAADEDALAVVRHLLSVEAQRYIADIGVLIPTHPDVRPPREAEENKLSIFWNGWDWFSNALMQQRSCKRTPILPLRT
ncbi:MAG: putative 2-aminoethylphosphonate-binding periplasmic protein [Chloroflexi bacterium]|nr:putative 2-aminoethylphosphonate-binding periplasmic protein [Chloroflexota bacterium]